MTTIGWADERSGEFPIEVRFVDEDLEFDLECSGTGGSKDRFLISDLRTYVAGLPGDASWFERTHVWEDPLAFRPRLVDESWRSAFEAECY